MGEVEFAIMDSLQPLLTAWSTVAEATVFVPVALIDEHLAALPAPVPLDIVKFMLTLFLALPLGFLNRFVPIGSPRHLYNLTLGVLFAQACYGPGWLHLMFTSVVSYMLLAMAPRASSHKLVFSWMMLYIGGTHLYRMHTEWLGWSMDFSGPQMMATIKITSLAFNYHDGVSGRDEPQRKKEVEIMNARVAVIRAELKAGELGHKKELTELQGKVLRCKLALDTLPGPLTFLAWMHNFSTYQAGPALEIQEYTSVNEVVPGTPRAGCALATAKHFIAGIVFLVVHMVVNENYPIGDAALGTKSPNGVLSDGFLSKNLIERLVYIMIAGIGVQCKYFMAWKLGEAAATAFGYGYNNGAWDGTQNLDFIEWFKAENMSTASKSWNQKTQVWLQTYTYFRFDGSRLGKLMATYAVSAYWHGFYPGYYITFFSLGLLSVGQDNLGKHVVPYLAGPDPKVVSPVMRLYNFVSLVAVHWIKAWATLPFLLCTLDNAYEAHKRLYFSGVIFVLAGMFLVPLIPVKPKAKPKQL